MAPPVSSALQRIFAAVAVVLFCAATHATTFPLPIPTRPTTFPLSRPSLAGEVVAWGSNTFGQITVPANATNIVAISAGFNHNLALRADGTVIAWGDNSYGQCNVPLGLSSVVAISGARAHSIALRSDGKIFAWGTNDARIQIPLSVTAVSIAADLETSLAVLPDGTPTGWGSGVDFGGTSFATNAVKIGRGFSQGIKTMLRADGIVVMSQPTGVTDVADIASGFDFVYPLRSDGTLFGDGSMPPGARVSAAGYAVRGRVAAAIRGDGTLLVWPAFSSLPVSAGYRLDPALGVLTNPPPRLRGLIAIEAGDSHFLALKLPTPPIPTTAHASAQIVNGFIVGMNILDGGEGYAVPPQVTITGGGGSGATATAQISKGIVTGFTITNAGIGYTSQPTVTIESPPFLPKLSIATSRVGVTMQVVPGKRYQLESSNDLPNFGPVGAPFVANTDTITQEFTVSETGQFFRIVEVP